MSRTTSTEAPAAWRTQFARDSCTIARDAASELGVFEGLGQVLG